MRASPQQLLSIPAKVGPLYLRIYHRIRCLILSGAWPPGTQLPSSRSLARDLGISRNTAVVAIEKLIADGWIFARTGSGVFVSSEAPPARPPLVVPPTDPVEQPNGPIPFEIGHAATDLFPVAAWAKIHTRLWAKAASEAMHEGSGAGWAPLRGAVAAYLHAVRGVACSPDQILILSSTQAAIDLTVRVLAKSGDSIWVEDPGYPYAREAFQAHGLNQVPVPVDYDGLVISEGVRRARDAGLAYVTPACQFPTCSILTVDRRSELLSWAINRKSFIIEDDWDFNAVFANQHSPEPLAASNSDRVIFVHSFNRILFPALRIAALVIPAALADRFVEARRAIDGFPNVANQIALTEFIERGLLSSHLRRARTICEERRAAFHAGVVEYLSPWLQMDEKRPGLHAVAWTRRQRDSELALAARRGGIACVGLSDFSLGPPVLPDAIILGFAPFSEPEIDRGLRHLRQLFASLS